MVVGRKSYVMPYAMLPVRPSSADPVISVTPDEEIGREGFTYRLRSGREETVHLDVVLDYNRDPDFIREQILYRLSVEAEAIVRSKRFPKRALARRLNTSPARILQLLDPTDYHKTIDQMMRLLHVLGARLDVVLRDAA